MKEYPIIKEHFTASDCYKSTKKITPSGIQVHSVGCKGTMMPRWKQSWNQPGRDVCAGYVIDTNAIYEILPEGKRCWLSGSGPNGNANNTHLGFEICEPLTKNDMPEVATDLYGKTLYLCTYLCRKFGIKPEKVQAHYELHALGLASNHADVRHWWGKKGTSWEPYTMDRLRQDIAKELNEKMNEPEFVQPDITSTLPTLRKGSKGPYVVTLQNLLIAEGVELPKFGADGGFGNETDAAVREFQIIAGLKVDGVVGALTWEALLENGSEDQPVDVPKEPLYTVTIPGLTLAQADALCAQYAGAVKEVG